MVTASASHSHGDEEDHDHDHEATASTCVAHNDHWDCPAGVAEPTTPPAATVSGSATVTPSGNAAESAAASSGLPEQTANAAVALGAGKVAAVLGAAAYFL
jgi:hypothetical protein